MNNSIRSGLSIQAATEGSGGFGGGGLAPHAGIKAENEEISLAAPSSSPSSSKSVEGTAQPAKAATRHHYDWLMM
jgi:hypothetical protein